MGAGPKVSTGLGEIEGRLIKTRSNRKINAFFNIPFAKPPIGNLRFARPEPVEPWSGCLNAGKRRASPCIQALVLMPESKFFMGSEDCLYLNVYSPRLPGSDNDQPLPVVVWIHGNLNTTTDVFRFFQLYT